MIKHIYLLQLKDRMMADEVMEKLLTLKEKIPYMLDMEVGMDFKGDKNSADIIEVCCFKNREDFLAFGADPYHAEIRNYINGVASGIKIDYEV